MEPVCFLSEDRQIIRHMDTGEQFAGEASGISKPERKRSRKRSIIIFTVISLLNAGLLILLWTQLLTPAQQSSSQATPSDPLIGATAPDFTLTILNGSGNQKLSLADFKGKPVVINFWSSTCAPCNDEMPLLESQWERVRSQGIVFLGIDVEDTSSDGLKFLRQHGVTYTSVIDSTGATLVSYGVTYTPETIFINRAGKVISAVRQEITSQQLQENLNKLLS
jgi:cytochrome c biogenesis protein CcmG/thiol:disulfide interchange protein DsbE